MTQVRKWLPREKLSSHGRGRGFESPIAHREKPLLSGGFVFVLGPRVHDLFGAHGRGQRQKALDLLAR